MPAENLTKQMPTLNLKNIFNDNDMTISTFIARAANDLKPF